MASTAQLRLRIFLWACAALFALAIGIQFIRPELTNPPVSAEIQAPEQVRQILRNSCYDCHSNETKLAWFDKIVPASWLVAKDVKAARQHVNFSEIGKLPIAQQKAILYEAVNEIQFGAMPLPSYRALHPHTAITQEQLAVLRAYLDAPTPHTPTAPADVSAADAQFAQWTQAGAAPINVRPSPNGIAFIPDYKNWKAISSTDRFDNNTIREVLGNDVAIKAISENHINPWPDGTAFAKVAWTKQTNADGVVHAGRFFQVEFMIRDSHQYAATRNWGFARWRGVDLKPYGKDVGFASECVDCHTPLRKNDYVFTSPIKGQR
jgi:Haem-binding domain/Cytochrome P460